ncbi:putative integral membrane protein [Legionella massiliensis]|uniref:Putative integral membrane protein n=1 Tax=Legionella massiliensis TaxID=1034943 RepID=A0A078KTG0_9GAMM|nr:DUF2269 family protein [Legionella massiliensis]CDZ77770.1 putative integral membrane protein [Legionella massiliensis]CEE13508.1 hypothetical protein BN1094_02060 [Legionella massiliensis]
MQSYLMLKMFHVFGVILFLGNIIVTAFWKTFADYSKDWRVIAFSQKLVTYTDIFFTAIGALILAVTGILMAKQYANFLHIKWIAWGLGLFIASGIIWVLILVPLQIKLHQIAKQFKTTQTVSDEYWRLEKFWMIFGIIATVLPLINLYWMVFKPN